jgi:predicted transcriptional regulator
LPTSRLPLDVKSFLTEMIESVAHLEVLLMLLSYPEKKFSAADVSRELRSNTHSATNQLNHLSQKGLLKSHDNNCFQYAPLTPEMDEKVKQLYDVYKEMPVAVVTWIYEKPQNKLKDFSDAFKLKKD